jgi:hypothetical protein
MMRTAGSMLVLAIVPLMAWRSPVGAADVATLRKQVDVLDAETNDLQARLTAVERTRVRYGGQPNVGAGPGGTSVLRAPFEVQDDKGKPILRVVERGTASRGLYVFNEQGNVAAQVAVLSDGGGRIFVYPGNQPFGGITTPAFAAMAYPSKGPVLEMTRPDGKELATISAEGFVAHNKNGVAVASLGSKNGSGAGNLMLGEPAGNAIVEAGLLPDGRGVVRAYPLGGKPPIPVPNLLMGARTK